jgi:uncharacterized protein YdaU (DUF1376 family)
MIKDVPYFQLYAANFLSNRQFKLMSLDERGILISIYMECWVNLSVPIEPAELAKCLGFSQQEASRALTTQVKSFLIEKEGSYISPELEGYREKFMEGRRKQSEGGKQGAKRKKEKAMGKIEEVEGIPEGQPKGSLIQIKSNQIKSNQLLKEGAMSNEIMKWVEEYTNAPDISVTYLSASKG